MDVTVENFASALGEFKVAVADAQLLSFDTELTGLDVSSETASHMNDTLVTRYLKAVENTEAFLITQFGVSTFAYDNDRREWSAKTFNFYVFPRSSYSNDKRFVCQATSLEFLTKYQFNFNKVFYEGVPYLSRAQEDRVRRHMARVPTVTEPIKLSAPSDLKLIAMLKTSLDQCKTSGKPWFRFPTRNSFERRLVYQFAEEREDVFVRKDEVDSCTLIVDLVTPEQKAERLKEMEQAKLDALEDAIGFRKVIDIMSQSRLPIVVHNGFVDLVQTYSQFVEPLPDNLSTFAGRLHVLFPHLYDTKYLSNHHPDLEALRHAHLSSLFELTQDLVSSESAVSSTPAAAATTDKVQSSRSPSTSRRARSAAVPHIVHAPGYDRYAIGDLPHEAGYDAYMTGSAFIRLMHSLGYLGEQKPLPHPFSHNTIAVYASDFQLRLAQAPVFPTRPDVLIVQYADQVAARTPSQVSRSVRAELGADIVRCVLPYQPKDIAYYVRLRTNIDAPDGVRLSDVQLPGASIYSFEDFAKEEFRRHSAQRKRKPSSLPVSSRSAFQALPASSPRVGALQVVLLTAAGFAAGYWFGKTSDA
mmetsp:Transcript_762/g.2370  ORF Transcript_762/g.2370 Transcript_762/m.2370 type:complete len:585 (+) Transcript_762:49-1803(+)